MKKFIYAASFILFSLPLFSQTTKITGTVTDGNDKPLAGASVFLKNKKQGTIADSSGHFLLSVEPGEQTLVVSCIGYAEQERNLFVRKGTVSKQDFSTTPVYKDCAEVVVICSPLNSRAKISLLEELKGADGQKASLELPMLIPKKNFEMP